MLINDARSNFNDGLAHPNPNLNSHVSQWFFSSDEKPVQRKLAHTS